MHNLIKKSAGSMLMIFLFSFSLWAQTKAEKAKPAAIPPPPPPVQVELLSNSVIGEVSAVTKDFIAIVYLRDKGTDYEIAIPVPKNVSIVHKKNLQELQVGDTVEVVYEDKQLTRQERKKDGSMESKAEVVERQAKEIRFIRRPIAGQLISQ